MFLIQRANMLRGSALLIAGVMLGGCFSAPESDKKTSAPAAATPNQPPATLAPPVDKQRKSHDIDLTGVVTDSANILSADEEQQLAEIAKAFEANPGDQIVFVTVASLGGEDIDSYSLRNANRWAVGDGDRDDGIIITVAPNERSVRIEVGRGVEWSLSNALCKTIIDTRMTPKFRAGNYAAGMAAGAQALLEKRRSDAKGRQQKPR
jgi:uncharacterized protein